MNAHALARQAYAASSKTVKTPRAIEYEAVARITHELKRAAAEKKTDFPKFVDAIYRNNQLWTLLASAVVDDDNALPAQVRAQIFYLSEFTKRHAAQVLAGAESVAPLLEVNAAILRGLRNEGTST